MARKPVETIVEALITQIQAGRYGPGDMVPSEAKLAEEYGLSVSTARDALRRLTFMGWLVGEQGRGLFVRRYVREPVRLDHGAAEGPVEVAAVAPPATLADVLGDDLVVRRRQLGAVVRDAFYPRWVVEQVPQLGNTLPLRARDVTVMGLTGAGLLVDKGRSRLRVVSRLPEPEESRLLGLPPGTAVQEHAVILRDEDGRVLVVRVTLAAGDRHMLELELP
ncbi:GntR family transcriptional regulator (plasmid) [Microtetraspora malaysiensis]|uniref:GntR family transcriptional regulator n=1 Tax=Microtetraspora malaysiensis TaxID=161358 RepID=UPI003D8C573D